MNTLKENTQHSNTSPSSSPKNEELSTNRQSKTPLKKEELEKIAKQLKKKLSKASITAKQQLSPTKFLTPRSSPLKSFMARRDIGSSPLFGSPTGKSPTSIKTPVAHFLSSSPLKHSTTLNSEQDILESPTRNHTRKSSSTTIPNNSNNNNAAFKNFNSNEQTMTLHQISPSPKTPPKNLAGTLKPSPNLQTTPQQRRSSLSTGYVRTPTQNTNNNDNEGADLLMYLATSPSPVKPPPPPPPFTPRLAITAASASADSNSMGSTSISAGGHNMASFPIGSVYPGSSQSTISTSSASTNPTTKSNSFIAPPPPSTPKRPMVPAARTPQNRLTPSINLFNGATNGGLPSSGLMLTPAGFNMNDYINFFSPSPGLSAQQSKNVGKTPDLHKQTVDGKMINFDKIGLFNQDQKNDS